MSIRLPRGFASLQRGWPSVELEHPLTGGVRTEVWSGRLQNDECRVVARRSIRSERSRTWEWTLLHHLASHGIDVPVLVAAADGAFDVDGWHVYRYIEGHPPAVNDPRLPETITRVHEATVGWPQRPGSLSASDLLTSCRGGDVDLAVMPADLVDVVRDAWRAALAEPRTAAVVHGDLSPRNALIDVRGRCVLLDWDEARVDAPMFDLAGNETQARAALAWEIATSWTAEPEYARARAVELFV